MRPIEYHGRFNAVHFSDGGSVFRFPRGVPVDVPDVVAGALTARGDFRESDQKAIPAETP